MTNTYTIKKDDYKFFSLNNEHFTPYYTKMLKLYNDSLQFIWIMLEAQIIILRNKNIYHTLKNLGGMDNLFKNVFYRLEHSSCATLFFSLTNALVYVDLDQCNIVTARYLNSTIPVLKAYIFTNHGDL